MDSPGKEDWGELLNDWECSEEIAEAPVSPVLVSKKKNRSRVCTKPVAAVNITESGRKCYLAENTELPIRFLLSNAAEFRNSKRMKTHNCENEDVLRIENIIYCLCELEDREVCNKLFKEALLRMQAIESNSHLYTGNLFDQLSIKENKKRFEVLSQIIQFVLKYIKYLVFLDINQHIENAIKIIQNFLMLSNFTQSFLDECISMHLRQQRNSSDFSYDCSNMYCEVNSAMLSMLAIINDVSSIRRELEMFELMYYNGCAVPPCKSFLYSFINRIIGEILFMASSKYQHLVDESKSSSLKNRSHFCERTLSTKSPFLCGCHKQLFILCTEVLNFTSENSQSIDRHSPSFYEENVEKPIWDIITSQITFTLHSMQQSSTDNTEKSVADFNYGNFPSMSDAITFSWWMTQHFTSTLALMQSENENQSVSISSSSVLLTRLLRHSTSMSGGSQSLLAWHLSCYESIIRFWREFKIVLSAADLAPFIMLWMYFARQMNTTEEQNIIMFKRDSFGKRTSGEWLTKVQKSLTEDTVVCAKLKDFQSFLRVLSAVLDVGEFNDLWKILRVRFFGVLKPNVIKELNEQGLENLFSIFFIFVTKCNNINEIIAQLFKVILDCLNHVSIGKIDYQKQNIVTTGVLTVIYCANKKQVNFEQCAEKCGKILCDMSKLFSLRCGNIEHRKQLWGVICGYLKNVSMIIEESESLDLGQHLFFSENCLKPTLEKIKTSECSMIVAYFSTIFVKLRDSLSKQSNVRSIHLCSILMNETHTWLKGLAKCPTSLTADISTLCIEMCHCARMLPTNETGTMNFFNLYEYFGCDPNVNLKIRYQFLFKTFQDNSILEIINNSNQSNYKTKENVAKLNNAIFRSWVSCSSLFKVCHSDENNDFDRLILKSIYFRNTVGTINELDLFWNFVKKLSEDYNACAFTERKKRKDSAIEQFSDFPAAIKKCLDEYYEGFVKADDIKTLYHVCGRIMELCARVLNSSTGNKANESFPLRIVSTLLVGQNPNGKVSVLSDDISDLHNCLHMFLIGLSSLDYTYNTAVQIALKDIFEIYFTRFPAKSHPLMRALKSPTISVIQTMYLLTSLHSSIYSCKPEHKPKIHTMIVNILFDWLSSNQSLNVKPILSLPKLCNEIQRTSASKQTAFIEKLGYIKTRIQS